MGDKKIMIKRVGDTKIKSYELNDPTVTVHQKLLEAGIPVPEIISIEKTKQGKLIKTVKWVPGETFAELIARQALTNDHWHAFGEFFAGMNNVGITATDLVYRNILLKEDGTVILCDMAKLYMSDFLEEPIVRYILNNMYFSRELKDAFLAGYRKHRPIDLNDLLDKEIAVNYDGYQDLYLSTDRIRKGVRSNKRLTMLKDKFAGKDVLDIGCSSGGMISRHVAHLGAHAIYGIDKVQRSGTRYMVDLARYLAYLENVNIEFSSIDCEHQHFINKIKDVAWDFIFFMAMVGHLKGDRVAYVRFLKSITKVLYFESNLGNRKEQTDIFLKEVGFSKVECLGESGDPDRDPNNHYVLYRCETGKG